MAGRINNRALARIEARARARALLIGREIVETIREGPTTPYDEKTHKPASEHLKNSYYAQLDPKTGDVLIKSHSRYWVYVEFGTRKADHKDMQMHVRPAIDLVKAKHRL